MVWYQRASLKWNKGWKISQWITAYLIRTVISYRSQKRRGRQKGTRKGKVALLDILWHFSSCLRVSNLFFLFVILYTHTLTVHCSVFILAHPLSTRCHTYSKDPFTRHFTKMTKSLVFVRSFVSKHPLVTERNFLSFKLNTKRASLLIKKKKKTNETKAKGWLGETRVRFVDLWSAMARCASRDGVTRRALPVDVQAATEAPAASTESFQCVDSVMQPESSFLSPSSPPRPLFVSPPRPF